MNVGVGYVNFVKNLINNAIMQDKAIAQIGHWQLEQNRDLDPVDLYIENMFPGKDYQMLLLVFVITGEENEFVCTFKKFDLQVIGKDTDNYRQFAFCPGTPNGGDVTFTTKVSIANKKDIYINCKKKIEKLKVRFKEIESYRLSKEMIEKEKENIETEKNIFSSISKYCSQNYFSLVKSSIKQILATEIVDQTIGISFRILYQDKELHLRDFSVIKELILKSGAETKYKTQTAQSIAQKKVCSVSGKSEKTIYGFASPFSFSTVDKPGFVAGFFDQNKNWRNYPISDKEATPLALGKRFIMENLRSSFYSKSYLIIPQPFVDRDFKNLSKLIDLIKTSLNATETQNTLERRARAENRIMRMIGDMNDYFTVNLIFFETQNAAFRIKLALEEVLPSRFKVLFNDAPQVVNKNRLFKDAIETKEGVFDLNFTFQIVKDFFYDRFLDAVQSIFKGERISEETIFSFIMKKIKVSFKAESRNKRSEVVKEAIMLIYYLQELQIIKPNTIKTDMGNVIVANQNECNDEGYQARFNKEEFINFLNENGNFFSDEIRKGLFGLGVLVRFLLDTQAYHLNRSTPFENNLHGYNLNPELLQSVYLNTLRKLSEYYNVYVHQELKDFVGNYFAIKSPQLLKMSNNEMSFYFVTGIELGDRFKREIKENNKSKE